MKYKYLLVLFLIISIFLSINMAVAADMDLNNVSDTLNNGNSLESIDIESSQSFDNVITVNNEENIVESSDTESILSDGYTVDVYVTDGEIGDIDTDPVHLGVVAINDEGVESATMNIHNGTYFMLTPDFDFPFDNVNELVINGVGGEVIFEPYVTSSGGGYSGAFGFYNSANIVFNNIIFDLSKLSSAKDKNLYVTPAEMPDADDGSDLFVTLNNCTFIGASDVVMENVYANTKYINCNFINFTGNYLFRSLSTDTYTYFENCVFSNVNVNYIGRAFHSDKDNYDLIFNGVWFGNNDIASSITNYPNNVATPGFILPIQKYALFSVSEKYSGDNKYEIVGKLTWNGTNSSEGMENFPPMTVTLTSGTGEIQSTAILVNGTFKANYTSSSSEHKVTAKLDSEEINLTFVSKAKDYTFDISEITNVKVGDTKEITITLPNDAEGQVVISIGNTNFTETVNGNTTKVNITGFVLGENIINITYSGNDRYESKTKNITVSAVKETTLTTTNVTTTYNVAKDLVITLAANGDVLANKTVNVVVGTINKNLTTNASGQVSIDVSTLAPNSYVANIAFEGDDLYLKSSTTANVVVNKFESSLSAPDITTTYNVAKDLVITLAANGYVLANKTVNVVVGTINKNLTTNASGQVSIDVSTLAPNTYVANIAFTGDDIYGNSSVTANVDVNKIASSIKATTVTATYNVAGNLVITLTANGKALANQKITVKVGTISKTLTTNDKGQVSVDVSKLTPKTYKATFIYAGDDINTKSSNTAKVVVNKAKPKITAKKATFKAKKKTKKYSIVLKDNKGKAIKKAKVTLKVKGKTYKATTNSKGKATFKITKLTKKGKNTATIKFGGNNYFKSISKKVNIVVKK